MRERVFAWSSVLFIVLVSLRVYANDYKVHATGSWFCVDPSSGSRNPMPLAGARVELMDSDCDGSEICDDVMGFSYVKDDGSFEIDGVGGDPGSWPWSKPDVYVRVLFTDDNGVRLTDELDYVRSAHTPEHDHDNTDGNIDFGVWTTGEGLNPGDGSKCGVFLAARQAYREYLNAYGTPPAGHYDVEYWSSMFAGTPWTNIATTHWPTHFGTGSVNRHEFAHSVRHSFDGDQNHFNWDVTRFRYGRNHDLCDSGKLAETHENQEGFAFNEGWAEYWEGATWGCGKCSGGSCDYSDLETEGNIAWALEQLSSCLGVGKAGMVAVLDGSLESIHSYEQFFTKFQAKFGSKGCSCSDHFFPGCGPTSFHAALTAPRFSVSFASNSAAQQLAVRTQLRQISSLTARLNGDLVRAQLTLRQHPGCDERDHCFASFQSYILPHMIQDRLQLLRIESNRLRSSTTKQYLESLKARRANGTLEQWVKSERDKYRRQILEIHLNALASAEHDAAQLARSSPDALILLRDLQQKIGRLKDKSTGERLLPTLTLEDVLPTEETHPRHRPEKMHP